MDPAPEPPPAPGAERLESVLICSCVIIPGFVAGVGHKGFGRGFEVLGSEIPRFVVWAAFVLLVIGCSSYGGWLLAARGEVEKRPGRFVLFSINILVAQIFLVPFVFLVAIIARAMS